MEEINYDELLNHEVIDKGFYKSAFLLLVSCFFVTAMTSTGQNIVLVVFALIGIVFAIVIVLPKRYSEKSEIRKIITFYNDCIGNNDCIEVDDDLKSGFIGMSKDIILHDLRVIWKPGFIYDDETKVYQVENTNIIIVNGYFEDENINRGVKRNYVIVFNDCKYYMSCIDNLICWEKSVYWSRFYKENQLEFNKVNYTRW